MDTEWLLILCAITAIAGFILGFSIGYEEFSPNKYQREIIDKACEYIYETESVDIYTQYCK